jgi:hypothetical protein
MYNTKTAITGNNEDFISNYMKVGINDNVTLKEVNVNKTQNGRDFLEIVFSNENDQTAKITFWKNEKNIWVKTDEELQHKDDQQFGQILQIIDSFYETRPEAEFNNFLEMINWVKEKLTPMIEAKKLLRIKVVYDNKGYTKVSTLGIFVEPMTVTETQVKLFKKDLLERPVVADTEPTTDPLSALNNVTTPVTEDSAKSADDLPF